MISASRSSRSRCVTDFTAPRVPTGMKAGVWITPCGVCTSPRRAAPSVCSSLNWNIPYQHVIFYSSSWRPTPTLLRSVARLRRATLRHLTQAAGAAVSRYPEGVKRLRVGVLYGGRSGEHEVSLASAAAVFAHLDRTRYEPVPIRIEKDGRWSIAERPPATMSAGEVIEQSRLEAHRPPRAGREVHLVAHPSEETILSIDRPRASRGDDGTQALVTGLNLDVIFPVLHGPFGEDGTIQGLLELANVPYVGAGVLASAVGMDKGMMKVVFAAHGLAVCPYAVVRAADWDARRADITVHLEGTLGYPMFVKPANLGSSVGISKAKSRPALQEAMDLARTFDRRIVVEAAVP